MSQLFASPSTSIAAALDASGWFLNSGIQDRSQDPSLQGGVNAWFDLRSGAYSFIYGEITGYAVNAYLFFHQLTGSPEYLEAAKRSAEWLLNNAYAETGLMRNRVNQPGFQVAYYEDWIFMFDQWIMVYGLACAYQQIRDARYLNQAALTAKFLLAKTVREDGSFYPVWNVRDARPQATGDKWSRQSGTFHAKALMALQKLWELSGDSSYKIAGEKLAAWTLARQEKNGRYVTQDSNHSTHLHPHLYTLEGLFSWGVSRSDEACIESARRGVEWILKNALRNGFIYSFYEGSSFLPFVRADIQAQTLRMGTLLSARGAFMDQGALRAIAEKLRTYQMTAGPQKGGFLYGQEQDGSVMYHVNAWVTMFAAQALWLQEEGRQYAPQALNFFV